MIAEHEIAARRAEYGSKNYSRMGFIVESRQPVYVSECRIGAIVQNWGLPNQDELMVVGHRENSSVVCITKDGRIVSLIQNAWMVVVSESTNARRVACAASFNLIEEVERVTRDLWLR